MDKDSKMNIGQFLGRWGTTGASLLLRSIAEMPTLLHRAEIQTELRRIADALEDALSSEANERSCVSEPSEPDSELHLCYGSTNLSAACSTRRSCYEFAGGGELFFHDGARGVQVSYCPYCGYKAKVPAKI
jgi:hypothetical protein